MSKTTHRESTAQDGSSVEHRLARLLDAPFLARIVPHLAPETLHQLVQHSGLDACGELVTAATPAQLTSLLDLDLWRHARPGQDEQFDVSRFGEWLEVLVDTGETVAARTVASLDTNLIVAGLSRYVRVLDPGIFEPTAQRDDETITLHEAMHEGDLVERRDDRLTCELGGYIIRGRRSDGWDSIIALLVALDTDYPDHFHAVMHGCRRLSNSRPEIGGLDDLLMAPEQHLHDVASDREQRRSQQGYASAADARAFLQLARLPQHRASTMNPIVAHYFRAAEEPADITPEDLPAGTPDGATWRPAIDSGAREDANVPTSIDGVIELLAEAGMLPERPRALLETADEDPRAAKLPTLKRLMEFVRQHDERAYLARGRELAFLANALLAGCSVQSRPFTPGEASDAAACVCNLGLERSLSPAPDVFLVDHDLVTAFEVGWSALYQEVSVFAVDQLMSALADLQCSDLDTRLQLHSLQRALLKHRDAPWLARGAADVLAMLDTTAWISVIGLLDECPIVPASLTAILERRTTSVSPTAFEFISSTAQLGEIRVFMKTLAGLLSV